MDLNYILRKVRKHQTNPVFRMQRLPKKKSEVATNFNCFSTGMLAEHGHGVQVGTSLSAEYSKGFLNYSAALGLVTG